MPLLAKGIPFFFIGEPAQAPVGFAMRRVLRYTSRVEPELIRHALEVARSHGFAEVEIESGGGRFAGTLERGKRAAATKPSPAAAEPTAVEPASNGYAEIKAPLVGYYQSGKQALEPGAAVQRGDVVAVITALGLSNEVESPHEGEIVDVLVKDGDPVEFGQVLARVKA